MSFNFLQFVFNVKGVYFYYTPPNIAVNMNTGKKFVNDKIYQSYKDNKVTHIEEEEKAKLLLKYLKNIL